VGAIVKMSLAAESHPDLHDALGSYHYTFSPECLDSFAEQAKGLPVRINFDGLPVGRVLAAERTTDGVELSIDTNADIAELVASPAFVAATDEWNADCSERVVRAAQLTEIGMTDD
jgi:hypothetical protein